MYSHKKNRHRTQMVVFSFWHIKQTVQLFILVGMFVTLLSYESGPSPAAAMPPQQTAYPVCTQSPLQVNLTTTDETNGDYRIYLPVIFKAPSPPLPTCTVYCGLYVENDPYRPAGYQTYFADEFDCNQLLDYWMVQPQMTAASYTPPTSGIVEVSQGSLKVGVSGADTSFPYLYLVDDSATTYDVPHTTTRVDWLPNSGSFRLAMRVRFNVEALGEHRISIYADGHRPNYAGPLFYIGTDYNAEQEAWRGLIVGADRGQNFVDLGEQGYPDPFTNWVVVTVDVDINSDTFKLSVDGSPMIIKPLSSFKDYPDAAIRPDILYLGSLALLEEATTWSDIEIDWIRAYAPSATPEAVYGQTEAIIETTPVPTDTTTIYSAALPDGPFANTPYWSEDFDGINQMPNYWNLVLNFDPTNAWTTVEASQAKILNNGTAEGVPVWAIYDDILPLDIFSTQQQQGRESPEEYLQRRGGSPLIPTPGKLGDLAIYPRQDWRPNSSNVRYAWRGFQSANGYGVEISNGGHGDLGSIVYFTGAMFYTLLDTTTPGGGQFIFPSCQEQYFWRLHLLPQYAVQDTWTTITADYINGTVHLYADGQKIGWWPESDCSLNWYLKGENATSPDVLFFGNPATAPNAPGGWSEVHVDWFATFPGLPRVPPL